MHLRSLRLRGFKSFPDSLELKLEPGVAVVVGPNGSGKSNVADAIVWAAGSLTPSELRAEKPDDVLFNGAEGRTPAESCEVELVFDNESGGFGELDFSEVSIARRLHRGGEGQYLVNRAQVRRTDLVELLADVGLGGSMHSIVSQGKVEAVLASKPEERRELVEEAAGLGKFKRRRHRAELKLNRVGIQVERARDVEAEVRKRLRPLALQATAAERAEKLAGEIAGLRARIAELDLAAADARRDAAEERKTAAALGRRSAQEKLTALLAERHAAEEELADAAGRRETAIKALYRLQSASERIALRQEGADALLTGLRADLANVVEPVDASELERATAAARSAGAAAGAAAERARAAQERLAALERGAAARAEERLETLRAERRGLELELGEAAAGRESATLQRLGVARERLGMRAESLSGFRERVRVELAAAEAAARRPGPAPAELEAAANEATTAARAAVHARDDLAERAALAKERLAALDRSLAEREGIPPAARALAEDGAQLALTLVDVEPGRERAVAAALSWRASAVVADDAPAGLAMLRRAREAGLGSLAVLIGKRPSERVAELPVVPLDDLLTATVPSVTEEGYGFDPVRGELWFAGEAAEAVLLELEARRRELAAEVESLQAQGREAAAEAEATAARAETAEAAFAQVAHLRGARAADPAVLRRLAADSEQLDEVLLAAVAVATRLEAPLGERAQRDAARAAGLAGELARVGTLEQEAQRASADANERAAAAELERVRLGGSGQIRLLHVGEGEREQVEGEARALTSEAERLAALAAEAHDAVAAAGSRRAQSFDADLVRRVLVGAERLAETLAAAAAAAGRFEAPLRARVDAGASRTGELGTALRDLGAAEVELRQGAEEAAQRATEIEIELTRIEADAADARRRLDEAAAQMFSAVAGPLGGPASLRKAQPAEGDVRDELAARAERLETRRIQLGQVNPLAKEEYEAEKERLAELETQREDLEQSLKELADLRDELAATVERRFADTYAAVAEHFEEVASTLFPGGEGRLRLVEPEEEGGETGVEVELRPAGKKITRLGMLSGGEKALGAISFLFALFLAKPCPFYLLDEVEAALDDANIGRFVELLRRYADRAQFVVITHQKRTMEAADVLYGVTMGGDGISQVVSRRLPREDAAALAS